MFKACVDLAPQDISLLSSHRWARKAGCQCDILGGVLEDICFSYSFRSTNFCPRSKLEPLLGSSSHFCNCLGWVVLASWPLLEQNDGQEAAVPVIVIALEDFKRHYLLPLSLSETSLQNTWLLPRRQCASSFLTMRMVQMDTFSFIVCVSAASGLDFVLHLNLGHLSRQLAPILYLPAVLN